MSGVLEKDRKPLPTKLRFLVLAKSLDAEATRLASQAIPKTYRFTIGTRLADAASEAAYQCDLSQEMFPSSALAAFERKRCYSVAIAKTKEVKRLLNKAADMHLAKASAFERAIADADELLACLRGLKKAVAVKGCESTEDAIRWHEAQIRALGAD